MKRLVIGVTLAVLAAAPAISLAEDTGGAAGNVEKASLFANGNVATIVAIGLGAATAIAVAVVASTDNGNTATATSTSTATATTR